MLVGVNVIREIPVSIVVLRRQAIRVRRGMLRPGMTFQRVILVDKRHPVAVLFEYFWKQSLVHACAIRAPEIVKIHHHYLGCLRPPPWIPPPRAWPPRCR